MRVTAGGMAVAAMLLVAAARPAMAKDHVRGMVLFEGSDGKCTHLGIGDGYTLDKSDDTAFWVIDNKDSLNIGFECGKLQMVALCVYDEKTGDLDRLAFERCTSNGPAKADLNVPFSVDDDRRVRLRCRAKKDNVKVQVVAHSEDTIEKCDETFADVQKRLSALRHHVIGIQIVP